MFSIGKKSLVGIDIGSNIIKAISLKGMKESEIAAIAYKKIGGEKQSGAVYDNLVEQKLKEISRMSSFAQSNSASTISDPSLMFINVKLPPMPKNEIMQAIKFEAKKQLTYPAQDAVIDYFIKDTERENDPTITATAIAVKKDSVNKHLALLKSAGFKPATVEIEAIPLLAAFDYNYSWESNKRIALLDIGAFKTLLVIVKERTIRFYREAPICGDSFTNLFKEMYKLSFMEAEEKKINMLGREEGKAKLFSDILDSDKLTALFEQFALEIQRSFDFYQAKYREGPVNELILSGGGALIQNIDAYFKEALGLPVKIDNPFKKLYFANKTDEEEYSKIAPIFTVALGLALRKG